MSIRIVDTLLAWALRVSSWFGWAALLLMVGLGAFDVVSTYFFKRAVVGAFEMAESALVVVMFIGLIHVQASRGHIVVDLLTSRLSGFPARLADSFALFGTALALFLVARQTWPLMLDSWAIREVAGGGFGFPVFPIKTLACLGATIAAAVAVAQLLQSLVRLFTARKGDVA